MFEQNILEFQEEFLLCPQWGEKVILGLKINTFELSSESSH